MRCPYCGGETSENSKFCNNCGKILNNEEVVEQIKSSNINRGGSTRIMKCPECGSHDLQAITETTTSVVTSGGGYSSTKGCLGWLMFGPFGLLCGSCGKSSKTTVSSSDKNFWICSKCGFKFRNLEEWKKEIDFQEKYEKVGFYIGMPAVIFSLLFFIIGQGLEVVGMIFLVGGFIDIGLSAIIKSSVAKDKSKYEDLQRRSTE